MIMLFSSDWYQQPGDISDFSSENMETGVLSAERGNGKLYEISSVIGRRARVASNMLGSAVTVASLLTGCLLSEPKDEASGTGGSEQFYGVADSEIGGSQISGVGGTGARARTETGGIAEISESGGISGAGGVSGAGGENSNGGASGMRVVSESGGASGTTGSSGSGEVSETGGASGTAGSSGSGEVSETGGASGSAGASGGGGESENSETEIGGYSGSSAGSAGVSGTVVVSETGENSETGGASGTIVVSEKGGASGAGGINGASGSSGMGVRSETGGASGSGGASGTIVVLEIGGAAGAAGAGGSGGESGSSGAEIGGYSGSSAGSVGSLSECAGTGGSNDCLKPLVIENIKTDVSPFGNEVTISWDTNDPATSYVSYTRDIFDGFYWQPIFNSELKTNHSITIDEGVSPNRTYSFRILSSENCNGPVDAYSDILTFQTENPHLLIVLSPNYSDNAEIDSAINAYSLAIAQEGWVTDILELNSTINDHAFVRAALMDRKKNANTTAAILVGEDLPFDHFDIERALDTQLTCPILDNWVEEKGIDGWGTNTIDIAVSLLVPSPYSNAVEDVEQAFLKFASDRSRTYPNDVALFYDPSLLHSGLNAPDYPELKMLGGLTVNTNTTQEDVYNVGPLKLLSLSGHGCPSSVRVTPYPGYAEFYSQDVGNIDVPFAVLSGCNTHCWFSKAGELAPYYTFGLRNFGGLTLGNGDLHALVASLPDQDEVEIVKIEGSWTPLSAILANPYSQDWMQMIEDRMVITNFYSYSLPKLAKGRSLAQAIYGATFFNDNVVVYGDITFHY
jgi:hypothetical protein